MRLIFWVTALAVLSLTNAKNSTTKAKPKRQLDNIRTPQNLQYSLVLPHSRVASFRSLTSSRRISHGVPRAGKLPPYAVQMEPVVQYSQKDPLYDPTLDNFDDTVVNQNEIYAQPKILNIHDQSAESYGPPFGSLPTAPLYSQGGHPHYYEAPEPIIEIIIKESNESLPAPPPQPIAKKKKEPVQVFYVKYSKDPHSKDKVVYEKPVPAITPPTNHQDENEHHEDYVTVTPEPFYGPRETTTLRAIIKPESEQYHSDSSVKVTFGNEGHGHHYSDRRESSSQTEDHEETAPRPAIAYPQQQPIHPPLERSATPKPQFHEPALRPQSHSGPTPQTYRPTQHAQSRIQFKQPNIPNEQQLPRQGPSVSPFRTQTLVPRPNPLGPSPSASPIGSFSSSGPGLFFANNGPGPITHFSNGPSVPGPVGPTFPPTFSRPSNNPPSFHSRQNPPFSSRPHYNGPPRGPPAFHSGPQRPFHQGPAQSFFDEPKYLQENYHTITTEQIDQSKDQLAPNRQPNFNFIPKPSPSPTPSHFQEHLSRPQHIPTSQQIPQQRPPQQFLDSHSKPSFAASPSRSPFFNLKPSPPQIEDNRPPFHQFSSVQNQPQQPPFSFHQGPQSQPRPTPPSPTQQSIRNQHSFPGPSPIPHTQFLPQPSSPPLFNFHAQPSPAPEQQNQFHHISPSERPHFAQPQGPSERPFLGSQSSFHDQANLQHQQNVGQFVPNGGELVAAIPKYEQHITVTGPTTDYSSLSGSNQPTPAASHNAERQYKEQQQRQQQLEHNQQQQIRQQQQQYQQQQQDQQRLQHQQQQYQQQQQQHQRQQQQQREQEQQQQQQQREQEHQQQQQYDAEQEQVRLQLAQNVKKQQEEIQRLQSQLLQAQQHQPQQQYQLTQPRNNYNQQQFESSSPKYQFSNDRQQQPTFSSSTPSPAYYQSTSRTVEIKPTTQKYVSSTLNSISTTPEAKKEEKKNKRPAVELPDEVPDDLRQQLLSSGILDNADISILDYDKVGETPLESLPPDQLANFFSAGGGQQIAASENRPIVVKPNGDFLQSRIDDEEEDDQEIAASENVPSYVAPPPSQKQAVEMKVVHFDPKSDKGQNIAKEYVKEDATQLEPVALNDKKYNRYLPLKVSGNQFPLPDILKGRKVTSVVVLAPVETEALNGDHSRAERATSTSLKGIKFVAGDSLYDLLKRPSKENFEKWLDTEKKTESDLQSVILLVLGNDTAPEEKEIFMYDVSSGNVNKLSGELSNAFVEAAENNSLSKDIEKLAIEGEGTPENFDKESDDKISEGSENVPLLVDLSGLSLDQENSNQVSISSGYSKTKLGRSLRRHS
ncbi:bromodomain-containing protein 4B [Cydia amplana]|uniref:bromodomain-containing protein 4B n=1 Tax=Cydia amplana TaxID=1869771 RepID=UPI002FE502CE